MAIRLKVTYTDGRVEEVIASPRAQVMTEERFGGINATNRLRSSYYMAWAALHKAGKEGADFEAFLDTIEGADEVDDEVILQADADPTQEEVPTTTSPD